MFRLQFKIVFNSKKCFNLKLLNIYNLIIIYVIIYNIK